MHPQLLNDLARAHRADLRRETDEWHSRAKVDAGRRGARPRARALAALLTNLAARIDPVAPSPTRETVAPGRAKALNV